MRLAVLFSRIVAAHCGYCTCTKCSKWRRDLCATCSCCVSRSCIDCIQNARVLLLFVHCMHVVYCVRLRSISQSCENRRQVLISLVIEQRIQCAITNAAPRSRGLDSISTSPQWQSTCCNLSGLVQPLLTQLSRQQRQRWAKMINNDWLALGWGGYLRIAVT